MGNESLALSIATRAWETKAGTASTVVKVRPVPGSSSHAVIVSNGQDSVPIRYNTHSVLSGSFAFTASRTRVDPWAFEVGSLRGVIQDPGWVETDTEGPYYALRVVIVGSAPPDISATSANVSVMSDHTGPWTRVATYDATEMLKESASASYGPWYQDLILIGGYDSKGRPNIFTVILGPRDDTTKGSNDMWISLIVMLVSFLLQNPQNAKERKKALLTSAALGAVTYGVTEYTDWGQENLKPLDDSISDFLTPDKKPKGGTTIGTGDKPDGGGFWSTLQSWGPAGVAAVGATVGAATGALPSWVLPAGLAVLAFVILK